MNVDFGINLSGGGARGSYQAGVLLGLSELLKEQQLLGEKNPFQYWSGVSAGSINSTICAAGLDDLNKTAERLVNLWSEITPEKVYRTDFASISKNSAKWIRDLSFGGLVKNKLARSLLDTEPLWGLLKESINFGEIKKNLELGYLKGLACSAYSYRDNRTVTFLQTLKDCSWSKPKRYSRLVEMGEEHVMASCAIPMLFPSISVDNEFFGDGSFRSTTPVSPLIHMGAKKIMMVGVRGPDEISGSPYIEEPGLAKIAGLILNAVFFDTIDIDIERISHINEMVRSLDNDIQTARSDYTVIDFIDVRPSQDISRMAGQKAKSFPRLINFMMGGLGTTHESAELASYILFVPEFTRDLIDLGYTDFIKQKKAILQWLES